MKFSRLAAMPLALLGFLLAPSLLAQKREDILSIQRDVAQLQDQIKQLQTSQDGGFPHVHTGQIRLDRLR